MCKKKSIKIVFSMKLIQLTEVSQFIQTIFKGEATNIKKNCKITIKKFIKIDLFINMMKNASIWMSERGAHALNNKFTIKCSHWNLNVERRPSPDAIVEIKIKDCKMFVELRINLNKKNYKDFMFWDWGVKLICHATKCKMWSCHVTFKISMKINLWRVRHKSLISQSHPHAITTFFHAIITKVWSAKSGVIRLMEKFLLQLSSAKERLKSKGDVRYH